MKVVEVIWVDASCETDYLCLEGAKQVAPIIRQTVGYLLDEESGCLICSGIVHKLYHNDNGYVYVQRIPQGMVKKINVLCNET